MTGAEVRRVENREYLGKEALVVVAIRTYPTTADDLWAAITTPERLVRWFSAVEGDLRLGGRFQIKGNASGSILRCERPEALDLTWEIMGGTSWVNLRIRPVGERAELTLEHIAHKDGIGAQHLERFGPGAVGIGWDLSLHGLSLHLKAPEHAVDHKEFEAWGASAEGKAWMRQSGEAWGDAHVASGEDPAVARQRAENTIAFYTGG